MDSEPGTTETLSTAELSEARQYGRLRLIAAVSDILLDLACLAAAAFWLARPIDLWLARWSWFARLATLRLAALFAIVAGLQLAVSLPLDFYSGYVLEHRFHLSTLSLPGWLWRSVKQTLLGGLLGLLLCLGLYAIIWTAGAWWWVAAAAAFFVTSVILGQVAPVLILPLFYSVKRLDDPELLARMRDLAQGTGLSIEGVYRLALSEETVKGNAMLAGLGRTRRVLIGDTLLAGYTLDELSVILAHEIGHHVFGHLRKILLAGGLYSLAGLWLSNLVLRLWLAGPAGRLDYAALPVYTLPMLLLVLRLFSLILEPLTNLVARRYERQCDRYALARTGLPAAYVSAFSKLSRLNKEDPDPPRLEVILFHSHPPIAQRIAMARQEQPLA
jgi:STE24 endopeptidase